jgi:hypothetical protein
MRGTLNIAAKAKKRDVDNRFSLKYYYRTADNLLKQVAMRSELPVVALIACCDRFIVIV